jgi:hypothetical protein
MIKPEIKNPKCICNSTKFHEFIKYSDTMKMPITYLQCKSCGLVMVPESKKHDLTKIYNTEYFTNVDYGWKYRAKKVVKYIKYLNVFLPLKKLQICDFGAGNGYLSRLLIDSGFNVLSYEPYISNDLYLEDSYFRDKPFNTDVLLMIEVFEHFTDAFEEIKKILNDFNNPRLIIFTTVLTDNTFENIGNWFYANPDAGHFTLWSKKSLELLGERYGYRLISLDTYLHIFCKVTDKKTYINLKILSIPTNLVVIMKNIFKKRI